MKAGGVVSLKKLNSFELFKNNNSIILMCLAFVAGILIGSFSYFYARNAQELSDYLFAQYIGDRQGVGFISVFFSSLFKDFAVCLCFFIFGASVIGVVLSPVFCSIIGAYYGFISAFSYQNYSLKGVAFNAIVLIPAALAFSVCVFFAAKESFRFSSVLVKLTLPKSRPSNISLEFKNYFGRFLIIFLGLIAVSLVDSAVTVSFIKFFNF